MTTINIVDPIYVKGILDSNESEFVSPETYEVLASNRHLRSGRHTGHNRRISLNCPKTTSLEEPWGHVGLVKLPSIEASTSREILEFLNSYEPAIRCDSLEFDRLVEQVLKSRYSDEKSTLPPRKFDLLTDNLYHAFFQFGYIVGTLLIIFGIAIAFTNLVGLTVPLIYGGVASLLVRAAIGRRDLCSDRS